MHITKTQNKPFSLILGLAAISFACLTTSYAAEEYRPTIDAFSKGTSGNLTTDSITLNNNVLGGSGTDDPGEKEFNKKGYLTYITPFVDGDYVYFSAAGSLNLMRIKSDGSSDSPYHMGGCKCKLPPLVDGGYVYFSDINSLMRAKSDGSESPHNIPYNSIIGNFSVDQGYVYVQDLMPSGGHSITRMKDDGSELVTLLPRGFTILALFVNDGYVYFSTTYNELRRLKIDGANGNSIGEVLKKECRIDSLFVDGEYIYFSRSEEDYNLMRVTKNDGLSSLYLDKDHNIRNFTVDGDYIYGVQSRTLTSGRLLCLNKNGTGRPINLGSYSAFPREPFVYGDYVYFSGTEEKRLLKTPKHNWIEFYVGFYTPTPIKDEDNVKVKVSANFMGQQQGTTNSKLNMDFPTESKLIAGDGGLIFNSFEEFKGGKVCGHGSSSNNTGDQYSYSATWQISYGSDGGKYTGSTLFAYSYNFPHSEYGSTTVTLSDCRTHTQISIGDFPSYNSGNNPPQKLSFINGKRVNLIFDISQ